MSLSELRQVFERRKYNLMKLLQEKPSELSIEKQHQVYGAILEIENFLRAIDHYRELEVRKGINKTIQKERIKKVLE